MYILLELCHETTMVMRPDEELYVLILLNNTSFALYSWRYCKANIIARRLLLHVHVVSFNALRLIEQCFAVAVSRTTEIYAEDYSQAFTVIPHPSNHPSRIT